MSQPTSPLLEEIKGVKAYLDVVREVLKSGYMPDLAGLDTRVAEICTKIKTADKATQKAGAPLLSQLINELDECAAGMRAWHDSKIKAGGQ